MAYIHVVDSLALSLLLCFIYHVLRTAYNQNISPQGIRIRQGHILRNQVTHARFLPTPSAHSFTYSTIFIFVSLTDLESYGLNLLGGWLFRYGSVWRNVVGIRAIKYLGEKHKVISIRAKLEYALSERGFDASVLGDVWMMTMPSIFGFEGLNPLTVYFSYNNSNVLKFVVLEVHNTFGEGHVYVLEVGNCEDNNRARGYDHQWTFPRNFFVSPFNDRTGFYTVAVKAPSLPLSDTPRPVVSIYLYMPDPDSTDAATPGVGPLKLTALLRTTTSSPLTTHNLILSLVANFLILFNTLPRILYQALILHYRKRLNIFAKPDPYPSIRQSSGDLKSGGIIWQKESFMEKYFRQRFYSFLQRRCQEVSIVVNLISGNPSVPLITFSSNLDDSSRRTLSISYTSPQFFIQAFLAPSAEFLLALGTAEGLFTVSDKELFLKIYSHSSQSNTIMSRLTHLIRSTVLPLGSRGKILQPHPLTAPSSLTSLSDFLAVSTVMILDYLEILVFSAARVRFMRGDEPWLRARWDRALFHMDLKSGTGLSTVEIEHGGLR
ncbi:hypothetical protein DEU56DRAFT_889632 [Suillus clintonianus]|uniref:uncharacterized protein n=1 Tax=Suillus clintonianus TaxID=1904413 RepID=UPI001B880DD9|nr:uncharacterized protein DEU56DRAFT_889632 [Suillus clintonianus]KAG2131654.1 hypothetical protein DEU56DRAFT_889632 [Suillus clintonianus]